MVPKTDWMPDLRKHIYTLAMHIGDPSQSGLFDAPVTRRPALSRLGFFSCAWCASGRRYAAQLHVERYPYRWASRRWDPRVVHPVLLASILSCFKVLIQS